MPNQATVNLTLNHVPVEGNQNVEVSAVIESSVLGYGDGVNITGQTINEVTARIYAGYGDRGKIVLKRGDNGMADPVATLRSIGEALIAEADALAATTVGRTEREPYPVRLLSTDKDGDVLFVGDDLDAAKDVARRDRYVREFTRPFPEGEHGVMFCVHLCDTEPSDDNPDDDYVAEWGSSVTSMDEAWRYALGATFGPLDSEYDEPHLLMVLDGARQQRAGEQRGYCDVHEDEHVFQNYPEPCIGWRVQ